MIKTIFLISLFYISSSFGCEIVLEKSLFIDDITNSSQWSGLSTNCPKDKLVNFNKIVRYFNGVIPTSVIKKKLNDYGVDVKTSLSKIKIEKLSSEIKKYFNKKETRNIQFESPIKNIAAQNIDVGHESISFENSSKNKESLPFSIEIKEKILHTSKNTTPFDSENISRNLAIESKWVRRDERNNYFSKKANLRNFLRYHSLSGFLKKGTPLTKLQFRKKNLLRFGQPVKVIFKHKNLKIKTTGTPQGNGGIHESVSIKLANNKVITGKIINKDTVSADL